MNIGVVRASSDPDLINWGFFCVCLADLVNNKIIEPDDNAAFSSSYLRI